MRRDFDLIRSILLDIEERSLPSNSSSYRYEHDDRDGVATALELLSDRGLISARKYPTLDGHPADWYFAPRLTWEGCDFLDSIRNPEIWRKTKEGAEKAGGFTFDLVKALAKGLLKKKIEQITGIELDL